MKVNNIIERMEQLKKEIKDNAGVNDDIICALCDELIFLSKTNKEWQNVAFGYVWRADYYFYVETNMEKVSKELDKAQIYIDLYKPSSLLEKFYTLQHLLEEDVFDIYSAFRSCLKALEVAEQLDNKYRIGANYGNLGTYFMDCGCYEEALIYTKKAEEILRTLPQTQVRVLRLLLSNLITIYLKLGDLISMKKTIEELSKLPIPQNDLQIYVNYGYLLYYAELSDRMQSLNYLQAMFDTGLMQLPNRAYIIELVTNALEAMFKIQEKEKAEELLKAMKSIIKEDETESLWALCKLRIRFFQQFYSDKELARCYEEYYNLYSKVHIKIKKLKADGLRAKLKLSDTYVQFSKSKLELNKLHNTINIDELTKVYSRRYMNLRIDEIVNSKKYKNVGFVIVDIDYFKEYNDFYGHIEGDNILYQVASILKENVNQQIEVCRYGGDEFVCIAWDITNEQMKDYIVKVKESLKEKNLEHIQSHCAEQVTLSIGYGGRTISTKVEVIALFDEVDQALYSAKNKGRNTMKSIEDMCV